MRVLVCGSRDWNDFETIHRELERLSPEVVITGGCRGADAIAHTWAKRRGIDAPEFRANWKAYGRAAGPIRNVQMLEEGKPDLVLAFHDNLAASKGTRDMCDQALRRGVRVTIKP